MHCKLFYFYDAQNIHQQLHNPSILNTPDEPRSRGAVGVVFTQPFILYFLLTCVSFSLLVVIRNRAISTLFLVIRVEKNQFGVNSSRTTNCETLRWLQRSSVRTECASAHAQIGDIDIYGRKKERIEETDVYAQAPNSEFLRLWLKYQVLKRGSVLLRFYQKIKKS